MLEAQQTISFLFLRVLLRFHYLNLDGAAKAFDNLHTLMQFYLIYVYTEGWQDAACKGGKWNWEKKKKKFTPLSRNVQHKKGIIAELAQSVMQILSAVLGGES